MGDEHKENQNPTNEYDGWGFDLFPERRGVFKPSMKNILLQGRGKENIERIKCEQKVTYCLNKSEYNNLYLIEFNYCLYS